ncbi:MULTISPECIES: S8 family peptidase [Clostridium]|uniref:S8 family peptidase n=1 Tax=Clostridium TaxID=1485 RepID=UPI00130534C4|nr:MULTISPECIES: S8 family peptidase [Clostridium]MBC2395647.1 S8 family peptidase [Clostridium acetobutylicum]MBC2586617.1 S8 family peptidase [Clostridium acetobutylicum]
MFTSKNDAFLDLFYNVPENVKNKLLTLKNINGAQNIEVVIKFVDNPANLKSSVDNLGGSFEDLGFGFGIVTIPISNLNRLNEITQIEYVELPKNLYADFMPANTASCVESAWNVYNLTGKGVLVGFIDSGIDYTHPTFMNKDGTSRILYIYDLSMGGKVWNNNDINRAIKSNNPASIVPERDQLGHGTHVAGIACGGGNIDRRYFGPAYESNIAMVKMTGEGKTAYGKSTQLMRGVKFLVDRANSMNMPLVINLSFSTNDGAHDGTSLLEQYIENICLLEKISFVISAGNEGDMGHHVGGVLRESQTISMNIAEGERSIILQLYKSFTQDIAVEVKNPANVSTGVINIKEGYNEGRIQNDRYFIYYSGPKPFSLNGEILINLVSDNEILTTGTWMITITKRSKTVGNYDIWMPVTEGLNPKTRFLRPNVYDTLGIPGTVRDAVTVGSYNYLTGAISSFSGRGRETGNPIKPDVIAPGENIESSTPGGGYDALSGTSMASPTVSGICALLMQWGIVLKKDIYLYGDRLKYYLLNGAKKDREDITYPNPSFGYGAVCISNALNLAVTRGEKELRQTIKTCANVYLRPDYLNITVEADSDIMQKMSKIDYACAFPIGDNYYVVSVQENRIDELLRAIPEILYYEIPALYSLCALSPLDTANINKFHDNPYLTLTGKGVIAGIIDTGMDYMSSEFMYEDNTTRIMTVWDQTATNDTNNTNVNYGREYSAADINAAIALKKNNGDPYSKVNFKDENSHGTKLAGIIGGRGKYVGAAPDCSFAVVKLIPPKRVTLERNGVSNPKCPVYASSSIIQGIKYLYDYAHKVNMPIVIYIPLGTNEGGHDGNTLIERYIDQISRVRGVAVVCGAGNEGDTNTHTSGTLRNTNDVNVIEVKSGQNQKNLPINIWINSPDRVSISITSPSGEIVEKIPPKYKGPSVTRLVYEGSTVTVEYHFPEALTGDELIRVYIQDIKPGIWKLNLTGEYVQNGQYNAWLPQKVLLEEGTEFLNPSQYITLTVPSTSQSVIACSYYNQDNNTLMSSSGRGYTRDNRISPIIAAGGYMVPTVDGDGQPVTLTGSSPAAAVLAGAVILMLQWGIVDGNDRTLYSTKIKTYLIRGANRREGEVYPNRETGYGLLDLSGVFERMRSKRRGVFVRIPKEIRKFFIK